MGYRLSVEDGASLQTLKNEFPKGAFCEVDGNICYQGGTPPGTLYYLPQSMKETAIQGVNASVDFVQDKTQELIRLFESVDMSTLVPNLFKSSKATEIQSLSSSDTIFSNGFEFEVTEKTEEAAYLRVQISNIDPVNALRFNWFYDESGEGILRVFVDGELVRQIDQRFITLASFETEDILIGMLEPGTHEIAFRLDGFATDAASSIRLTDVELGFYEVTPDSEQTIVVQPDANTGKDVRTRSIKNSEPHGAKRQFGQRNLLTLI